MRGEVEKYKGKRGRLERGKKQTCRTAEQMLGKIIFKFKNFKNSIKKMIPALALRLTAALPLLLWLTFFYCL